MLEAIDRILRIIGFEKDDYIAIPLSEFARLEEFMRSEMERQASMTWAQYYRKNISLIYL